MGSLRREYYLLKRYVANALNCRGRHPQWFGWMDAVSYYQPWRRTMNAEGHCLEHELPWLTFPAIERLSSFLTPKMKVFEYGSGGSTLFFARRAKEVISVEHDADWHKRLASNLKEKNIDNCIVHHIPPSSDDRLENADPSDPDSYTSGGDRYKGMSFRDYAAKIEEHPNNYFDIVVVDGRARPSCFKHAVSKVRDDGLLVFDNTSRDRYGPAMALAADHFEFRRCPGPTPFLGHFTETSLWKS